jgi:hypothetical protein
LQKIPNFKALLIVPESKNNPLSKVKDLIKKNAIKENVILLN